MSKPDQSLVLVLGDQLSLNLSSLRQADKSKDIVLMAEVMAEAIYARPPQKETSFWSSQPCVILRGSCA